MKLKFNNRKFCDEKGWHNVEYPEGSVSNFSEAEKFFHDLFEEKGYVKSIEFVDVGKKSIIRAEFWYGPFNTSPIKFEIESGYSKSFKTHQLLNAVIGALSKSSAYFIKTKKNKIIIGKMIEVM